MLNSQIKQIYKIYSYGLFLPIILYKTIVILSYLSSTVLPPYRPVYLLDTSCFPLLPPVPDINTSSYHHIFHYLKPWVSLYRNQGYDFTITSSTAYDQKWIYGRNIYQNISRLVDSVFANFVSRPGIQQPLFTSYCDGTRTTCSGLSQWGSKYLGDQGYSAISILRNYYGNDVFINTASTISGVPSSWPGYNLTIGSRGDKVRQLQQQLNRIGQNYPAIPRIVADGIYGPRTQAAVRTFQTVFNLPPTGITDFATWYAISRIYVAVSRIAEPGS